MGQLSNYLSSLRRSKGLTLGQLANAIGYRNVTKGSNRIHEFESLGLCHPELLDRLVRALGAAPATVERHNAADRRQRYAAWSRWANEPIRPYLCVRHMPAVYFREMLPEQVGTAAEAEAYAARVARR